MTPQDKLKLIEEYSNEYYKGRFYEFTQGGFVVLQPIYTEEGYSMYIHDMFVSKDYRTGAVLYRLIKIMEKYVKDNEPVSAYCRIEKGNPYLKTIQALYRKYNFKEIHSSDTEIFYKRSFK